METVDKAWKRYAALEFGLESLKEIPKENVEQQWQTDYEKIKKLKPVLSTKKDGTLTVTGIK